MEQSVHSVTNHTADILTLHLLEWPTGTAVPSSCPSSTAARLTRWRKTLLDQPVLRFRSWALWTATASGLQAQSNRGLRWLDILMKGTETEASQREKHLIAQLVHAAFLAETQGFVKRKLELNPLGSAKGAVLDNATSSLVIVQRDFGFVNWGNPWRRGVNRVHHGLDPTGPRQVYLPEGIKTRKCRIAPLSFRLLLIPLFHVLLGILHGGLCTCLPFRHCKSEVSFYWTHIVQGAEYVYDFWKVRSFIPC